MAASFFTLLDAVFFSSAYMLACLLSGLALANLIGLKTDTIVEVSAAGYIGLAFAIGQATIGGVFEIVAAVSWFTPWFVAGILLVGSLSGLPIALRAVPSVTGKIIDFYNSFLADNLPIQIVTILILVFVVLLAAATLHPPGTDALAYYLAQAKLIAVTGHFTPLTTYESFSQIGLAGEMHFAALYLFSGELAAKMIVWAVVMNNLALMWAIGSRLGLGRSGQLFLVVLLLTSTAFTNIAWDGKSELFATAWGLGAVYAVLLIGTLPDRTSFALAGLLAGASMAGKLSFVVVLVPLLGILFIWRVWMCDAERTKLVSLVMPVLQKALVVSAWATITILPMIIKNWIIYDQPLAPIYLFGESQMTGLLNQGWFSPEDTRWIVMSYPLALIFGQYPMQHGTISPLWLALLPLLVFVPRPVNLKRSPLFVLSIASLIAIVFWVVLRPGAFAPRYILVPLLTILPLVAYGAEFVVKKPNAKLLKFVVLAGTISLLLSAEIRLYHVIKKSMVYVRQTTDHSWTNPVWAMPEHVARNGESGSRIFLGMYYRSILRGDLLQCVLSNREMVEISEGSSSREMWEKLHRAGGQFMIVDKLTHGSLFKFDIDTTDTPSWLEVEAIVYPGDRFVMYSLAVDENAPKSESTCVEQENGNWQVEAKFG